MQLEDLRLGADVVSDDGHKVGTLSRFVINKDSLKLTHIVVDTGVLRSGESLWKGGWGTSHDRIVPIGVLKHADSASLRITMLADDFVELSRDFEEEHFTELPDRVEGWPDLSDIRRVAASLPGEPGPYLMHETNVLAQHEADIPNDAPVWRMDPHQKIGEVERVLFDEDTREMSALVIRRGHFFSKEVLLPVEHLVEVVAGVVRVQLDDAELRALPEYKPQD
jgi:sporulation protein YlmC with PRC-barrel domain